jgi:PAS domain S-box-containing protein
MLVIIAILAAILVIQMINQDFTTAIIRADLALQGMQIRAESLELVNEAHHYILPGTDAPMREDLRQKIYSRRVLIDRLIEETVDMTTPGDLAERTRLARIQERVVNLYLQINRLIEAYDAEGTLGPETTAAIDVLIAEYAQPLTLEISAFQQYELSRVRETQNSALRLMQTTLAGMVVVALVAISFTGSTVWALFHSIVFPLDRLRDGVNRLRQGELEHNIPIEARNEIGLLAETLNSMAAQLRQTLMGLENNLQDLKQAQEEQRRSEEHYRSLFNGIPIGLYRSTREGKVLAANPALVTLLHYPDFATLAANSSVSFYVDPNDRLRWQARMDHHGQVRHYEVRMRCYDGSILWMRENSYSILDENNQLLYYEGSLEDITSLKQAEEAIQKLNAELELRVVERTEQLQIANKELEAFSYSVSHDLRAPLRALDGYSKLLTEEYAHALDEQGLEYLQRLRQASQRMGDLIDDLLMLSRITRRDIQRSRVDLAEIARTVTAELRTNHPERQVEIVIPDQLFAKADPNLIRIVLENLIGNAWKFTAKHARARIEFGMAPDQQGKPVYFVRDDGAGFDMNYVHRLFGAFQRLHASDDFEGTGIGLATVQRIVRRHGGQIWAEGAIERGAAFYFTLAE